MVSLMDLMRTLTGEVSSRSMCSPGPSNHVDLNLFADLVVTLNHIAHVMEGEIHNGGIIDVVLHS